jgi:Inner membrane component of T3SS, cytoplasmic domain/Domain of unknown function (DUF1707)
MAGTVGGSEPPQPPLRASDAEREEAVAALRERFAAGQLSQNTFVSRMGAALGARDRGELADLFSDLGGSRWQRAAGWSGLRPRLAGAASALWEAVAGSARRASDPPRLMFPAGDQARFTIGRNPDCDLVIPDISVSRWHAGLARGANGWLLSDLGSTNGTRLNGWRVRDAVPVRCGDRVSFGAVTFELGDHALGLPVG